MSRAERRRDEARIVQQRRRIKRAGGLTSALVAADQDLRSHPFGQLYIGGIAEFRRQPPGSMKCIGDGCEITFGSSEAPVAYLLATVESAPTSSSVSGFCAGCFERPMAAIEADCARTLSRFAPNARFEPLTHDTS